MSSSRQYEIRVRGKIGPRLLHAFPELSASRSGPDTVLTGSLADPAALYGVIYHLEALALELLEVRSPSLAGHGGNSQNGKCAQARSSRAKGDPT